MKKLHFETLNSTNTFLKENFQDLEDFTCVSAGVQTAGRGRMGRTWESTQGSALFSILVKSDLWLAFLDRVPLIAAVAVHKVLSKKLSGLQIKWPNDIVFEHHKIAGILTESIIERTKPIALIVGIGVNVNNPEFPEEIKPKATSLFLLTGISYDLLAIIDEIAETFQTEFKNWQKGSNQFVEYCNKHSSLLHQTITSYKNGIRLEGIAGRILQEGSLTVQVGNEIMTLHSGEVTLQNHYSKKIDEPLVN
jgi:BirA family biotin operon repressor/biotin-[acetyl-CoA-carboxylase] ligase